MLHNMRHIFFYHEACADFSSLHIQVTLHDFFRENGFMLRHKITFSLHGAEGALQQLISYTQMEELGAPG